MKYFRRDIRKRYGLEWVDYDDLVQEQEGRCAICRDPFNDDDTVDHCHTTGKVRGLLCSHCNKGLGFFKDSVLSLFRAVQYLTRGK